MKVLQFTILISLLPFLLNSCKDDEPIWKTYGPYYMGEARDYIYFKKGTWWVYENIETKERDSMVLEWVVLDTVSYGDNHRGTSDNIVIKEKLEYTIRSITTGYEYDHTIPAPSVWEGMTEEGISNFYIDRNKSKPGDYRGWYFAFLYPFEVGRKSYNSTILNADTVLSIQNKEYHNVVKIEGRNQGRLVPNIIFFWAPNYGLIQYIDYDNFGNTETWQLVNSHILQ